VHRLHDLLFLLGRSTCAAHCFWYLQSQCPPLHVQSRVCLVLCKAGLLGGHSYATWCQSIGGKLHKEELLFPWCCLREKVAVAKPITSHRMAAWQGNAITIAPLEANQIRCVWPGSGLRQFPRWSPSPSG
jgi:hypothetical protein